MKPHVFNSKSPDYLRFYNLSSFVHWIIDFFSIYNTLSKNSKTQNDNEFKYKINYFSTATTEREKNSEPQQNASFFGTDNLSKNNNSNTVRTNIYQSNNVNKTPSNGNNWIFLLNYLKISWFFFSAKQ